jgi:hypothetical protein
MKRYIRLYIDMSGKRNQEEQVGDWGRNVAGLDATAAQSFGTLWNQVLGLGVEMVVTHLDNPQTRDLLAAHGIHVVLPGSKDPSPYACQCAHTYIHSSSAALL